MSFHGGDQGKDYCKTYFPECWANGTVSLARRESCKLLGGTINACGCCMCRKWPGTERGEGDGGSFKCITCINEGKLRCAGANCPSGSCGKGRFCGADGCGICKPGCQCLRGARTLCPLVRAL